MTMKKVNLLTFSELDDVFFDFFEDKVVFDGYYIKFLDCQPKQILTEKEYNLSGLKNYDLYRDQHYDDYINYFRRLFELFDCIYVDYPLQTFIKDSLIDDTTNTLETFFPFLNSNEIIMLLEKKDDFITNVDGEGELRLCDSIDFLLAMLKIAMHEVFFPIFHFKNDSAYLVIQSDVDLSYKILFNEKAKEMLHKTHAYYSLYIRD